MSIAAMVILAVLALMVMWICGVFEGINKTVEW